jgi:hypothetical protein
MNFHGILIIACLFLGLARAENKAAGLSLQNIENENVQCCKEPISWRFGHIDPRFNLNKKTIKNLMQQVGEIWSDAADMELWVYSDSGQVELNLIYSEAQKFTDSERDLFMRMNKMKLNYYALNMDYNDLCSQHQKLEEKYNQTLSEYHKRIQQYNYGRARWNQDGAMSSTEKKYLNDRKEHIENFKRDLNNQQKKLNDLIKKLNQLSTQLNHYADRVNEVVYQYKEQFGEDKTFHQGFYINNGVQKKINIYQFDNIDKLRLVLAHEVGHALGLKHVGNPKSIMYYKMERQDVHNLKLTQEDIEAIRKKIMNESENQAKRN